MNICWIKQKHFWKETHFEISIVIVISSLYTLEIAYKNKILLTLQTANKNNLSI